MKKAIGMIEFKTVASGITATDAMVKTAQVEIVEAQTVCPGKYMAIVAGELSSVQNAIELVRKQFPANLIGDFVLGNPHEDVFPALYGSSHVKEMKALGILETYDVASIIVAADLAAKTAMVQLIEVRVAKGMCGKSFLLLTGEVAAVEAAIEAGKKHIGSQGMLLDSSVIASPDAKLTRTIL